MRKLRKDETGSREPEKSVPAGSRINRDKVHEKSGGKKPLERKSENKG